MFNSHVELPEGIWIMNSHKVSQVWGNNNCQVAIVQWDEKLAKNHDKNDTTGWNFQGPNGTTPMELLVEYPSPKVLFCNIPWGWRIILSHPSLAAWNSLFPLYHTYGRNTTINRPNSPWEKLNLPRLFRARKPHTKHSPTFFPNSPVHFVEILQKKNI